MEAAETAVTKGKQGRAERWNVPDNLHSMRGAIPLRWTTTGMAPTVLAVIGLLAQGGRSIHSVQMSSMTVGQMVASHIIE